MAEEFRVSLGVTLNQTQLGSVRTTLSNLTSGTHRVRIDLDTRRVQQQINSIRNQIQNLGRIRIDLGGNNNGGGGRGNNGLRHTVDDANRAYNELMSLQRRISSASKSIEILDVDANERQIASLSSQLDILLERYNALMSAFENDLSYNQLDNLRRASEITDEKIEELQSRVADLRRNLAERISTRLFTGDFQNQLNTLQDSYNRIGVSNQNLVQSIENVRLALADMNTANASGDIELLIDAQQRYIIALETANNALKDFKRTQNSNNQDTKLGQDIELFRQKIQIWSKDNSSAAREFATRLDDIQNRLNNCNRTQLDGLKREFKQLQNEAELANTGFKKFFNDLGNQMSNYGIYLSASEMIMYSVQAIKDGISTVKELDTALIDLQKTAEASSEQLEKFYFDANETAKKYGSTTQEIIQSAADWSRLGFSLDDSQLMAQYSSMLRSISSDLDIDTATNGLVSIMKAYGIEAENVLDGVLSKINAVGNSAATSNGEIVQGLQNSAAAMAIMGTTFDETIALFTAGQEITQDASKVGNALRTISMRIRGYDEETEELSEDLANITGEVIDLTKVASRPEGISLFTDETQTEYKSMYVYLQEISQIFDELGAKQQQELLEKLFGKNRAAVGAAIIKNFQAAEDAMNTMAESAGNAEAEMTVIMDSIDYKLNRLKETGTGIAQNLFQREDMKLVLDVLTDLLGLVDKLTESLGLFGTVGIGVSLFGIFKKNFISDAIKTLNDVGWSFSNLSEVVQMTGVSLRDFMKTPAGVATKIGLITTAISFAVNAYQNWRAEQERIRQESLTSNNAILDSVDTFEQVYSKYAGQESLTSEQENEIISAINATISAYGDKASAIQNVIDKNGDYIKSLEEVSIAELNEAKQIAEDNLLDAKEELKSNAQDLITGTYNIEVDLSPNNTNAWGVKLSGDALNASEIANKYLSDYYDKDIGAARANYNEPSELIDYYYTLIELKKELGEQDLESTDTYSDVKRVIDNLSGSVEEYLTQQYNVAKYNYEIANGIPKTVEEYHAMKNAIISNIGATGQYANAIEKIADTEWGQIFNLDGYYATAEKIATIEKKFTESNTYKNGTGSEQRARHNAFYRWLKNLSENDLNIVYDIAVNTETAEWTLTEWQNALENYEIPEEKKISFTDLMKNEDFKTTVNDYIEQVGVLQEALGKLQSGEWNSATDLPAFLDVFNKLKKTFPDVEYEADNLEGTIVNLLDSMNDKQLDAFISQFGYLKTDDDVAALETFMNSVLKLGQVVGDTSFSINISAETEKINNLLNAITESVSSTGLSTESIKNIENMFSGLDGYDPSKLFESTEHGIHLNIQALRGLQTQYEAVTKIDIQEHLQDLKQEYNSAKNELEGLTEGTVEWYQASAKLEHIKNQINEVQQLQAQYEGLTSAYNQWLMAQSTENENDAFLKVSNGIEGIKELFKEGWVGTDDFREAVQLMTDTDLSTASVEDILAVYEKGMPLMEKFFTGGTDGLLNFLNVAKDASDKFNEDWVTLSDDGNWHIDFGIGGDEDIAKAISDMTGLSMSTEQVQILLRALSSAGFDVNLDAAYSSTEALKSRVEGTEEYLKSLGEDPVDIDIYCHDDNVYTEIEKAKAKIAEIENSDVDINVKTAQLADAEAKLDVLIKRQIELTQPRFMSVDASTVDTEIQGTLILLQEYQTAINNVEALKLKGADASEIEAATGKVQELAGEIAALPDDAKTAVGLELENNTDDINAVIELINTQVANIDATICPTADMTQVTSDIAEIEGQEVSVDVITTGEQAIQNLKNAIDEIEDKTITVTAEVKGTNLVNALKSAIDKLYSKTVYATTITRTIAQSGGTTRANETAFANGSIGRAFNRGDWSIKDSGVALGGELGQELVVRDGHYFTIGDNSAEFFQYKKGDIIFNAEQTKQLFTNGRISNGSKRGNAFVNGSVTGRAFSNASGSIIIDGNVSTTPSDGGSNSGSSSDEFKETFDWIEIAIDRIEQAIEKLDKKASSTYKSWGSRNKALKEQISEVKNEIELQERAYTRYIEQANSIGLSDSWATKVRNGEVNIEDITDESLAEQIQEYQEWYEKALDCKDAIDELHESVSSLYEDGFDNLVSEYNDQLSLIEHLSNSYQNGIDTLEARGYLSSTQYYSALQDAERQKIDILNEELESLKQSLSEAMSSGEIEEGSEAWYAMQIEINGVKEQIDEANLALIEYNNTMRELEWEYFDFVQERISQLTQESNFLIDLMSNSDLYTDNGTLTDTGTATMGLHALNYNTYMAQADKYAEEMLEIEKQLAEDPYNTQLIERREELLGLQQDSILAAEAEKQAIVDMVREGIELELESLKELINTYTDALDSAKDLYDYQKKIKNHTSDIANIQKQLSAYENDFSEETKAKVQKLQVELKEAEENLEETEYQRYISEQKKLLDNLYLEYETVLNQRLDNVDALVENMIGTVNTNTDSINATLNEVANNVGYTMTDNMQSIWDGSTNALDGTLTMYGDGFNEQLTAINNVLNQIQANTSAMIETSDVIADADVNETIPSTPTPESSEPSAGDTIIPTEPPADKPIEQSEKAITIGGKINAKGAKIYSYAGDTSGEKQYFDNDPIYTVLGESNGYFKVRHHKLSSGVTGWFKRNDVKAYKTGGLVDYTGLAWVDGKKTKPESFLDAQDTENFIALKDTLRKLTEQGLPFSSMYGLTSIPNFSDLIDITSLQSIGTPNGVNIGDITITIPIEHVENYDDFVAQLQKDKQFERMVQSMTVDRLVGGTALKKNRFQFGR